MQIVILSALGNVTASRCLQSLLSTTASECFDLHLFRERQFREHTLNAAKEMVGSDDDVLFVGDDIEFTPGWYEALMKYYEHADILGMSMLYPNSSKVQDRGYDMLRIDDHITWSARDRGVNKDRIDPFGIRPCDAVCGCFLFVKSSVLQLVPKFREQGKNCLGELIFMCEARKKGASIAVTDHFLYHDGISTKSNPDQELSSISYLKERDLLQSIVSDFADETWVRYELRRALSPELKKVLSHSSGQILIYGIGTVTEGILNMLDLRDQEVSFCSGLPEEAGLDYFGRQVVAVKDVSFDQFRTILITPLDIGEEIYRETVLPRLSTNTTTRAYIVEASQANGELVYGISKMK